MRVPVSALTVDTLPDDYSPRRQSPSQTLRHTSPEAFTHPQEPRRT